VAVVEVALQHLGRDDAWDAWRVDLIIGPSSKTLAFRVVSLKDALALQDAATDREIREAQLWP
jgi:hypothetical protein